jgi:hypothetical protein
LAHNLSRFELHRCSRRDLEAAARLIRITADPLPGQTHLEDTKIPKFDILSSRQTIGYQVESPLDHFENLVLDHSGIVTNPYNDFPFRQVSHLKSFRMINFPGWFGNPNTASARLATPGR